MGVSTWSPKSSLPCWLFLLHTRRFGLLAPEGEPRKSLGHPGARIIDLDETGFEPRNWDELTTVALYRRFRAVPGFFGLE